jgi:hypothetical protein
LLPLLRQQAQGAIQGDPVTVHPSPGKQRLDRGDGEMLVGIHVELGTQTKPRLLLPLGALRPAHCCLNVPLSEADLRREGIEERCNRGRLDGPEALPRMRHGQERPVEVTLRLFDSPQHELAE